MTDSYAQRYRGVTRLTPEQGGKFHAPVGPDAETVARIRAADDRAPKPDPGPKPKPDPVGAVVGDWYYYRDSGTGKPFCCFVGQYLGQGRFQPPSWLNGLREFGPYSEGKWSAQAFSPNLIRLEKEPTLAEWLSMGGSAPR